VVELVAFGLLVVGRSIDSLFAMYSRVCYALVCFIRVRFDALCYVRASRDYKIIQGSAFLVR